MGTICTGSECPFFSYSDELFSDEGTCVRDGAPIVADEDECPYGELRTGVDPDE